MINDLVPGAQRLNFLIPLMYSTPTRVLRLCKRPRETKRVRLSVISLFMTQSLNLTQYVQLMTAQVRRILVVVLYDKFKPSGFLCSNSETGDSPGPSV